MQTIAIIDDKPEMRETVATLIGAELQALGIDWEVIDIDPLPTVDDYNAWIQSHGVCVLVLDENLSEDHAPDQAAVAYPGHEVAAVVRRLRPDLPQFIITSIVDDNDELETSTGDLEAVIIDNSVTHDNR